MSQYGPSKKILIIDDDNWIHLFLRNVLESIGFEVYYAKDAFDGLNQAIAVQPDAILLDIIMPVVNGDVLIQFLKTLEITAKIPVIMLSGHLDTSVVAKTFKIGAIGFISKPFTRELFIEKLTEFMGMPNPLENK